jgi:autotransporter-associated beta strand protein
VLNGTHTIGVPVVMNTVTGFDVAAGAQLNVTQGLSGVFPLTKTGLGVMTLGGPGNYGGATQVNGGTLRLLTPNAIPSNDLGAPPVCWTSTDRASSCRT